MSGRRPHLLSVETVVRYRRAWCFLVHRWWVPTERSRMPNALCTPFTEGMYFCRRCGEIWSRS